MMLVLRQEKSFKVNINLIINKGKIINNQKIQLSKKLIIYKPQGVKKKKIRKNDQYILNQIFELISKSLKYF